MADRQRDSQSVNRGDLRRSNLGICLVALRGSDTLTVSDMAGLTGLSRPTIESLVQELDDYGLVEEVGVPSIAERSLGRPARHYSFNASARWVVSVDIGVRAMSAVVADLRGTVRALLRQAVPDPVRGDQRLEAVRDLVTSLLTRAGLDIRSVHTVVISVPAIVDDSGHVLLSNPVPDWTGVDLGARFRTLLGTEVIVENDINMSASAEHEVGAGRYAEDMMFVHVGRRMNVGLVLGGHLYRGHHFSAGEVADVAERLWDLILGGGSSSLHSFGEEEGKEILSRAAQGDEEAQTRIRTVADGLAFSLAAASAALDPEVIVVGGGLSEAGETLVVPIRHALSQVFHNRPAPKIVVSRLGSDGTLLGGVIRGLEAVNENLYRIPNLPLPPVSTEVTAVDHETPTFMEEEGTVADAK